MHILVYLCEFFSAVIRLWSISYIRPQFWQYQIFHKTNISRQKCYVFYLTFLWFPLKSSIICFSFIHHSYFTNCLSIAFTYTLTSLFGDNYFGFCLLFGNPCLPFLNEITIAYSLSLTALINPQLLIDLYSSCEALSLSPPISSDDLASIFAYVFITFIMIKMTLPRVSPWNWHTTTWGNREM